MDQINRDRLGELASWNRPGCVSMYLPTHTAGPETRQDPIRLKNLVTGAETQLREAGVDKREAGEILQPARRLLDDADFWKHQSDGLALFVGDGLAHSYRLPATFDELLVVSDRFHLKPLLPLLAGDGRFYVLALSQNEVRVLHGTRFSVSELDVGGIPESLAEALKFDDPELSLQFRPGGAEKGGGREPIFHGHGAAKDEHKNRLLRYFQKIDRGLHDLLATERVPLVLAGVDYYFPIYREANTYPRLLDEGVPGNPENFQPEEIHARAWERVEPIFTEDRRQALENYGQAVGQSDRTSTDIKRIVRAAHEGRVGTLFVAVGVQVWGTYDPEKGAVQRHDEQQPGDLDLLDLAAVQTFLTDGTVHALNPEEIPGQGPAAAIYRY